MARWRTDPRLPDEVGVFEQALLYSDLVTHPEFWWIAPSRIPKNPVDGMTVVVTDAEAEAAISRLDDGALVNAALRRAMPWSRPVSFVAFVRRIEGSQEHVLRVSVAGAVSGVSAKPTWQQLVRLRQEYEMAAKILSFDRHDAFNGYAAQARAASSGVSPAAASRAEAAVNAKLIALAAPWRDEDNGGLAPGAAADAVHKARWASYLATAAAVRHAAIDAAFT